MFYGNVQPAMTTGQTPETFRDVGPTSDGFKYRQYANGVIMILEAPHQGIFGGWLVGTKGGYLQGKQLTPTDPLWAKVTKEIGEHPYQKQLRQMGAGAGPGGSRGYTSPTAGPYAGLGAAWVDTFTNITSGFTEDPQGEEGAVVAAGVQAVPGVQNTIAQLTQPSTLEGMAKKLGRLKGQLATTRDPAKRAVLTEQINALEFKIGNLQQLMQPTTTGAADAPPAAGSIWPFVIGGGLALVGLSVFAAAGKRGRR